MYFDWSGNREEMKQIMLDPKKIISPTPEYLLTIPFKIKYIYWTINK